VLLTRFLSAQLSRAAANTLEAGFSSTAFARNSTAPALNALHPHFLVPCAVVKMVGIRQCSASAWPAIPRGHSRHADVCDRHPNWRVVPSSRNSSVTQKLATESGRFQQASPAAHQIIVINNPPYSPSFESACCYLQRVHQRHIIHWCGHHTLVCRLDITCGRLHSPRSDGVGETKRADGESCRSPASGRHRFEMERLVRQPCARPSRLLVVKASHLSRCG